MTHTGSFDLIITGGTVVDGAGAPGFRADVGVRGETIAAATYEAPHRYPEGIAQVIVAGRVAVEHGVQSGERYGGTLRL
ncbi:MAG: hypothetical protein J7M38_02930 [Armatimonadetes bacterium]|nr:hypothetical protein [Armatimonadota bacterium]